ncbi:major facilitator superfamily domain-containing protein [Halenospora varia]|nr:major facilitator superfamily domain-containing protein [Halenospora varia]
MKDGYISLVAASCMVLCGYDALVFNSVQGSRRWELYFNNPYAELFGAVNTSYTVGAIIAGFFLGGPLSDYYRRRWGMGIGCFATIIATPMQTFSSRGKFEYFIGGGVLIEMGQGIALTAGLMYIGELAPASIRGKIMTFWQMFYTVGSFIAYGINYICSLHRERPGEWDWIVILLVLRVTRNTNTTIDTSRF